MNETAEYVPGEVPCAVPECACEKNCHDPLAVVGETEATDIDLATFSPEQIDKLAAAGLIEDEPIDRTITDRLGAYMAESEMLYQQGWNVRMRYDEKLGSLTAVIGKPPFNAPASYTVFRVPEDSIGAHGIRNACALARDAGYPISWERPIQMTDYMFLTFWMAFRDHFDGALPSGWPLPQGQQ